MAGPDLHVLPVNDLREHEETRFCWCRPVVDDECGTALVVHHSLDGREYAEAGGPACAEQVH